MPTLLLFRHAYAEQVGKDGPTDHDRVLSARGRAEAAETGRLMAERNLVPDLVLCSTATRARQTWEAARPALVSTPPPRFLESIFDAQGDYLGILRREGGSAAAVVLVGHNPTMQATAARLASETDAAFGENFPTAAVAIFDFDGAWADLQPGAARLAAFIRPSPAGPR